MTVEFTFFKISINKNFKNNISSSVGWCNEYPMFYRSFSNNKKGEKNIGAWIYPQIISGVFILLKFRFSFLIYFDKDSFKEKGKRKYYEVKDWK